MRMYSTVLFLMCVAVCYCSCSRPSLVRELQIEQDGVAFNCGISADMKNPEKIIGRLKVINTGMRMVRYGNFQLYLKAGGNKAVTCVDAENASSMVDTGLVSLSPGDTLEFFTCWLFDEKVKFNNAQFALEYRPEITRPAP